MIRNRWLAATFVVLAASLATAPSSAEVIAEFAGGGSNAAPVTDVVDAFNGKAGGGWSEPWSEYVNGSGQTHTIATSSSNPLDDETGNYLDVTMATTSTGRNASVQRSYADGIDVTKPHSIDFKYRINEDISGESSTFGHSNDRYQLMDVAENRATANGDCSWIIGVYGASATWLDASKVGKWVVFDGGGHDATPSNGFTDAGNINTGITVQTGVVYDFHLDIDPDNYSWDVTIGAGGETLYNSRTAFPNGLGWRTLADEIAGRLTFGAYANAASETRAYSLDSLRITQVPEPSALLLLISAGLALAATRHGRWRRRSQ